MLQAMKKWSIHGVEIVGVESQGRLPGRALRIAAVIGNLRERSSVSWIFPS